MHPATYSPRMRFCGCTAQFGDGTAQVKLPSSLITFRVDSLLPGISREDFEAACMEAWRRWERVIGVRVDKHSNPKTSPTQIVNAVRLDRAGGVLADQALPFGSGLELPMRVDTSERWWYQNDKTPQGYMNLVAVLCHEDGHCLGMQHIDKDQTPDLMNAFYSPEIFIPQNDDIVYGRKLYGGPIAPPSPAPGPGPRPTIAGLTYTTSVTDHGTTVSCRLEAAKPGFQLAFNGQPKEWQPVAQINQDRFPTGPIVVPPIAYTREDFEGNDDDTDILNEGELQ